MARNQKDFTFDYNLRMKDAGAVTADAAAQVSSAAKVLDFGAARVDGRVIVDVSALDVTSGDELYLLKFQVSNTADLSAGVVCVSALVLGHSSVTGNSAASATGRYELAVTNEVNGTTYRYARMYTDVAGTTPSINYVANFVQSL